MHRSGAMVADGAWVGLSERARRVCEWFGIKPGSGWMHEARDGVALPEVRGGEIVLLTGASGSGKSSILRGYLKARRDDVEVVDVAGLPMPGARVVELFPEMRMETWLGMLSRVGLAEAQSYLLRCGELSEGQRWRLRIGMVMGMVEGEKKGSGFGVQGSEKEVRGRVVVCDEFCALPDRVTACVVARGLRRLVDRTAGLRAVVATSHDDLEGALRPDVVVECDFGVVRRRTARMGTNERNGMTRGKE